MRRSYATLVDRRPSVVGRHRRPGLVGRARAGHLATAVALILLAVVAAPAHATNFGSTSCSGSGPAGATCVSRQPNATVNVWRGNLTTTALNATTYAWQTVYGATDLAYVFTATSSQPYDVVYWDQTYPSLNLYGWTFCPATAPQTGSGASRTCTRQEIRYNLSLATGSTWTTARWRSLACHETGHAVGLRHTPGTTHPDPAASCMGGATTTVLHAHDIAHINGAY